MHFFSLQKPKGQHFTMAAVKFVKVNERSSFNIILVVLESEMLHTSKFPVALEKKIVFKLLPYIKLVDILVM